MSSSDGNFSVSIEGLDALMSKLNTLAGEKAEEAMAKALHKEAEAIMTASKDLVPFETGNLKASGHVALPEVDGRHVSVTLGYGGPSVDYAAAVHENLSAHHPHGQAKYLEQPATEAQAGMVERLAATAREELGL